MTIAEFKEAMRQQKKIIADCRTEMVRLKKEMAQQAPWKVGDVVEANGYSYAGKPFQATEVYVSEGSYDNHYYFQARGKNIKKDGTLGELYLGRTEKIDE